MASSPLSSDKAKDSGGRQKSSEDQVDAEAKVVSFLLVTFVQAKSAVRKLLLHLDEIVDTFAGEFNAIIGNLGEVLDDTERSLSTQVLLGDLVVGIGCSLTLSGRTSEELTHTRQSTNNVKTIGRTVPLIFLAVRASLLEVFHHVEQVLRCVFEVDRAHDSSGDTSETTAGSSAELFEALLAELPEGGGESSGVLCQFSCLQAASLVGCVELAALIDSAQDHIDHGVDGFDGTGDIDFTLDLLASFAATFSRCPDEKSRIHSITYCLATVHEAIPLLLHGWVSHG